MSKLDVIARLEDLLGHRVITDPQVLQDKGHDESYHSWSAPLAVVQPLNAAEVSTVLRLCNQYHTPVVPRGAGTGLEGGANTEADSICLDLSLMNEIAELALEDMYARVQPGVMKSQLNDALEPQGLHFPSGPSIDASVGGMVSTSASGTTAVSYGTMKEAVLGLTVVMADGSIIETGSTTRKTSSGYDLTHLIVGSEGTLGVVVEVTVRVHALPETTSASVWSFPSVNDAIDVVIQGLRSPIRFARVELLDALTVEALCSYRGDLDWSPANTLMVEFSGSVEEVSSQVREFRRLAERHLATEITTVNNSAEAAALWAIRADVLPACMALTPQAVPFATDICVPISNLAQCVTETTRDLKTFGVMGPLHGHVGDGNFHVALPIIPGNAETLRKVEQINGRLVRRALSMGGTCTGEHGIGLGKIEPMKEEHYSGFPVMVSIKQTLDPKNILNPGKIIPKIYVEAK